MTLGRKGTTAALPRLGALALALTLALLVGGCGTSRCARQCPADTEPTERQRQVCEEGTAPFPACQAQYTALADCSAGLTVCGKDDRTDQAGTAQVVLKECSPQLTAYTDCASSQVKR